MAFEKFLIYKVKFSPKQFVKSRHRKLHYSSNVFEKPWRGKLYKMIFLQRSW